MPTPFSPRSSHSHLRLARSSFAAAIALVYTALTVVAEAAPPAPTRAPLSRVADRDIGEVQAIQLANGATATVRLLDVAVRRDSMSGAVRSAAVMVEVNGITATLGCANYHLPITVAGVQIDCPVVKAYNNNSDTDRWGLDKDARVRVWPAGSPWIEPGTF